MYGSGPLTQQLAVLDSLQPVSNTTTTNGAAIDMLYYNRLMYVLLIGVIASTGTVDFKLQSAAATGFGTPHDMTGKAITQITQAGSGSGKIAKVACTSEDVGATTNQGDRYVRCVLVTATAASVIGYVALGGSGNYNPIKNEIAAVVQTIADAS